MKSYTVTGWSVTLHSGVVGLTDEQANARIHALKDLKGGKYKILTPITFKNGEEFGFDGEVNKALTQDIQLANAAKRKAAKKDEADKEPAEPSTAPLEEEAQKDSDTSTEATEEERQPENKKSSRKGKQ